MKNREARVAELLEWLKFWPGNLHYLDAIGNTFKEISLILVAQETKIKELKEQLSQKDE